MRAHDEENLYELLALWMNAIPWFKKTGAHCKAAKYGVVFGATNTGEKELAVNKAHLFMGGAEEFTRFVWALADGEYKRGNTPKRGKK